MPPRRYVKTPKALLRGAKRLQFLFHCGNISAYSSPNEIVDFNNDNDNDNDMIHDDPDHVELAISEPKVGTPEADAWYKALGKQASDFQHVTSLSVWIGIGSDHVVRDVNSLLAACAAAGVKNLKMMELHNAWSKANFAELDTTVLHKLSTTVEQLAILNIKTVEASASQLWNAVEPANLTTLRVTLDASGKGDHSQLIHATLQHLRRFTALQSLQFSQEYYKYSNAIPDLPWFGELCNLLVSKNSLPRLTHLESADLQAPQLVTLLMNNSSPQLEKLKLTWHQYGEVGWVFDEERLEQAIAENVSLKHLSLNFQVWSQAPKAESLFQGIARNSTLEAFDLHPWNFRLGGHQLIENAIATNKGIKRITFQLRDADNWCQHVVLCLAKNTTIKCAKIIADPVSSDGTMIRVGMLNSSLKHLEVSLEGPPGRLYGTGFVEELKQNMGIQTLKLRHRRSCNDTWHEFTSPAIQRQLLLTQKLSGNITEKVGSLGLWPHLLEMASREKPLFVPKLIQDLSQVWQKSSSRKRVADEALPY